MGELRDLEDLWATHVDLFYGFAGRLFGMLSASSWEIRPFLWCGCLLVGNSAPCYANVFCGIFF